MSKRLAPSDCFREIGFDNAVYLDGAKETIFFLRPACVDDTPGSRRMESVSPEAVEEFIDYWQNQIDVARDYIKNGQNPNTHEWK